VAELRRQAAASGIVWLEADLQGVRDKSGLMQAMAEALAVPAGFGANWDALADSLQDLGWRAAAGYVLQVRHPDTARTALGPEWFRFMQILRESAKAWAMRGKPFVALVDGAAELPAWT
jgi:hypothetical protein